MRFQSTPHFFSEAVSASIRAGQIEDAPMAGDVDEDL